jgi:tight adherence protein B
VAVLSGVSFGGGIAGIVWAWRIDRPDQAGSSRVVPAVARLPRQAPLLVLAAAAGLLAALATGWPVAVAIVGVAVFGLPKLFGQTAGSISIVKIEAIAVWTEMLQGTLAASAGLTQAIVATAPLSPLPIRGAAIRLSGRLTAGMHPNEALLLFADDLGDPCADRVVCALQLAVSSRAHRMGDLLTALADSTRDEVALRLRIETSRASIRSGVRTVVVVSVVFAVGLAVLAHPYLEPFGSADGQVILLMVGVLYGLGLTLMVSLARPPAPVRLLGQQVVAR